MTHQEYQDRIESTLLAIEEAVENLLQNSDLDIDYDTGGGLLTISLGECGKIILNQQEPLQQLWLAAKSGGYHLDWTEQGWVTIRGKAEPLTELFNRVFTEQTGYNPNFNFDPKHLGQL